MKVLLTGGAGFIGSHTYLVLKQAGYEPVIVDDFSNASPSVADSLTQATGAPAQIYYMDITSSELDKVFKTEHFDAVIHFAGKKAVAESIENPLHYYNNNIGGTLNLLNCMTKYNVNRLVFSSSATVYDPANTPPMQENYPLKPINPYGRSKLFVEEIIRDACHSPWSLNALSLRYFNPVGAHPQGFLGEDPQGTPTNLFPIICRVLAGEVDFLPVYGDDYPTKDGTCLRDYIHVLDLAKAHLAALKHVDDMPGERIINLGTGTAYSVLEVVKAFEGVTGKKVNHKIMPRRPGDAPISFAAVEKAKTMLGWQTKLDLQQMCRDAWNYKSRRDIV